MPSHLQVAVDGFRRRWGRDAAEQALKFDRDQQLTDREIEVLARTELALDALLTRGTGNLAGLVALELKRQGEFATALGRVSAKQRLR